MQPIQGKRPLLYLAASLIVSHATLAQSPGYMKGTSWTATAVDGANHPYKAFADGSDSCEFLMQLLRLDDASQSEYNGYEIMMTSLGCADATSTAAAVMTFETFDVKPDEFVGYGISDPSNKADGEIGRFAFSNDRQAVRLIRTEGDSGVDRQRFRIRFDDVDAPTKGTLVLETRNGTNWETDATIALVPAQHSTRLENPLGSNQRRFRR